VGRIREAEKTQYKEGRRNSRGEGTEKTAIPWAEHSEMRQKIPTAYDDSLILDLTSPGEKRGKMRWCERRVHKIPKRTR